MFSKKSLKTKSNLTKDDLEYISSLSAAALEKTNSRVSALIYIVLIIVVSLLVWAYNAKIDQITKGEGKVVPSGKIQIIQNLEGGIVEKILTSEGRMVRKGDVLLKIKNLKFQSDFKDNKVDYDSLLVQSIRLRAEFLGHDLKFTQEELKGRELLASSEKSLFISRRKQLKSQIDIIQNQLESKEYELIDAKSKKKFLTKNLKLLQKELLITEPLVKNGIVSEMDFLKSKREYNNNSKEYKSMKILIPKIYVEINEQKNKLIQADLEFKNDAKKELNDVLSKLLKLSNQKLALGDQVNRTEIKSPVSGVVKQLHVNTIGGIIKPGMDIVEIVPIDDKLIIEAKIKPSDIAFLKPNLPVLVKFTAYDFSIYGGLHGKLIKISADTIEDKKGNSFYIVQIETDKIATNEKFSKLDIISG